MNERLINELVFKFIRSSGSGGQNVNKVSTKVELRFNIISSQVLDNREKSILIDRLGNRLNLKYDLILTSDDTRSQLKNKEIVTKRFIELLKDALVVTKPRIKTKPTKSSVVRRLESKRKVGMKKKDRRKFD
ncbi:MAG: aminoacyl-tRNA hydrolase [Lentimicrobiaceae bacterium]|jgi:ribosome-associated protein|nr:aminoacyl-tRNA hydrolase [Lentimicrobiaceae bacterium]MCP4911429.1 aminoacyl-tRNA hydrolase [Bacteroidota bacterium]MBT3454623.1 aminoacyl-tRNA hydrolase [Lentimicrobiaceae bacterium]MBT3818321.1 aminoacyl-tRNA hydrolase [Lentimicrobiaceae bacterium]MBT4062198.1 aminoacyl-tRNA hydrolase [Lentimicrobiaceae bacterium]